MLPWGVRIPDKAEPGHADSAPVKPMLGRKVLATTAITAVLWLIVYVVVQSDWLPRMIATGLAPICAFQKPVSRSCKEARIIGTRYPVAR